MEPVQISHPNKKGVQFSPNIVAVFKIAGNNLIFLPWVMCSSPSPVLWLGVRYHTLRSWPHARGCDGGGTCGDSSTGTTWKGTSRSLKKESGDLE